MLLQPKNFHVFLFWRGWLQYVRQYLETVDVKLRRIILFNLLCNEPFNVIPKLGTLIETGFQAFIRQDLGQCRARLQTTWSGDICSVQVFLQYCVLTSNDPDQPLTHHSDEKNEQDDSRDYLKQICIRLVKLTFTPIRS